MSSTNSTYSIVPFYNPLTPNTEDPVSNPLAIVFLLTLMIISDLWGWRRKPRNINPLDVRFLSHLSQQCLCLWCVKHIYYFDYCYDAMIREWLWGQPGLFLFSISVALTSKLLLYKLNEVHFRVYRSYIIPGFITKNRRQIFLPVLLFYFYW